MFGFESMESMAFNYKERLVENTKVNGAVIDTCRVTDSSNAYEIDITHPYYNNNRWVIVETYDTKEEARRGHKKWVDIFSSPELPEVLTDEGTSGVGVIYKMLGGKTKHEKTITA